jgi:hypothetical protein
MRRLIAALSLIAILWGGTAGAATVDAARIAAVDKAADAFLKLGKDAYKTGEPPRQSTPQVEKLLATLCDTGGLNDGKAVPFSDLTKLNDWLMKLTQVGMVYILAGTGVSDTAKLGEIDDKGKAKIAANTVAFAPELGRYIDATLAVMQAEMATILVKMTEDPASLATPKAQHGLGETRAGVTRTLAGVVTTMPTPGLDPAWAVARLPALAAIAPVAAAFLPEENRKQLHDLTVATAETLKDEKAKAGLASFAKTIAP